MNRIESGQTWINVRTKMVVKINAVHGREIQVRFPDESLYLQDENGFREDYVRFWAPAPPKPEITLGSVVRLKSGGPKMMVEMMIETHTIQCAWFTTWGDREEFHREDFYLNCLELVEDDDGESTQTVPVGSVG